MGSPQASDGDPWVTETIFYAATALCCLLVGDDVEARRLRYHAVRRGLVEVAYHDRATTDLGFHGVEVRVRIYHFLAHFSQ